MKMIDDRKSIRNDNDCAIRAVSHLTGDSYDDVLAFYSERRCYNPKKGTDHIWTYKHIWPAYLDKKITVNRLAQVMKGVPFVGLSRNHAMYVNADSELVDAFDSSRFGVDTVLVNLHDKDAMKERLKTL